MVWSGLEENSALGEMAAHCRRGRALTRTRKATDEQDLRGRVHTSPNITKMAHAAQGQASFGVNDEPSDLTEPRSGTVDHTTRDGYGLGETREHLLPGSMS